HVLTDRSAAAISASETLLHGDDGARATFLPDGRPPRAGTRLPQPMLARTLRLLALEGRDAFYRGPIAREIVASLADAGGVMSAEDLAAHTGEWGDPIRTAYRDVEACTTPPNSQGITALIALNVLTALRERGWPELPGDRPLPPGDAASAGRIHAQAEALKAAWAERDANVADPVRHRVDVAGLLSTEHAAAIGGRLDPRRAQRFEPSVVTAAGTVYLAAADGDGGVASLIESNYMGFGAGIMAGGTGVMLQNRGAYFSLDEDAPNVVAPGARPLHTLMPGMLLRHGRPWAALGAMGGDGQPQTMLQLVNALVDDGLDAQQAVERARFLLEVDAPERPLWRMTVEPALATDGTLAELRERGHAIRTLERLDPLMGWAQIVTRDPETSSLTGGGDPRTDSVAIGL
ncbi:MAG: gamma-glutamyltransferase, partial [Chloroflexota bacterium]|nr:gamma-glutamyltransferase [Chloroflexota bacterium]